MFNLRFIFILFVIFGCGGAEKNVPVNEMSNDGKSSSSLNALQPSNYKQINFQTLNYYTIMKPSQPSAFDTNDEFGLIPNNPEDTINRQVPTDVLKLDGLNIEISGFIFPTKLKLGHTSEFVLMSILPSCCFGDNLNINDIIYVDANEALQKLKKDQFVTVKGKLTIGMTQVVNGKEKFLYWLKAKEVIFGKPGI